MFSFQGKTCLSVFKFVFSTKFLLDIWFHILLCFFFFLSVQPLKSELSCFSNKATKLDSTLLQLTLFSGSSHFLFLPLSVLFFQMRHCSSLLTSLLKYYLIIYFLIVTFLIYNTSSCTQISLFLNVFFFFLYFL